MAAAEIPVKFRLFLFVCVFETLITSCKRTEVNEKNCTELFYHIIKIVGEDESVERPLRKIILESLLEENKPEAFISECLKSKSSHQLECEFKAENFSMLRKCGIKKNQ